MKKFICAYQAADNYTSMRYIYQEDFHFLQEQKSPLAETSGPGRDGAFAPSQRLKDGSQRSPDGA
jgi:hypothetical protein